MRVLFVDDEERVLDGLRRMLRGQRHEWDMVFVTSGKDALEAVEAQPFDVVISDMKMPGMNGAELLTRIRDIAPATVRIILSGQADKESIIDAIPVTHQYLAKPCEPEVVKDVVSRAHELHRNLSDPNLAALLGQVTSLPTLPDLFAELNSALKTEDVSAAKVGDIIGQDIGMSGELLKIVNSAFFGLRREVASVDRAVSFLGMETISALVMGSKVFEQFDQDRIPDFDLRALWEHCICTANIARSIAQFEEFEKEQSDVTFMAGLLHDAGKLVLAANLTEKYAEVLKLIADEGLMTGEAERRVLGTTHGEVGAYLFGTWGLPAPLVEAVAYHVDPSNSPASEFGMLGVIHVADVLAKFPAGGEFRTPDLDVDWDYLEAKGKADHWAHWCERAAAMFAAESGA